MSEEKINNEEKLNEKEINSQNCEHYSNKTQKKKENLIGDFSFACGGLSIIASAINFIVVPLSFVALIFISFTPLIESSTDGLLNKVTMFITISLILSALGILLGVISMCQYKKNKKAIGGIIMSIIGIILSILVNRIILQ